MRFQCPPSELQPTAARYSMSSLPPVLGADGPHTLDALQDTDGKPDYPLHIIIVFTLLGAPFKRATLDQIRKRMEAKFPYFLRHTKWKVCLWLQ